MSILFDLADKSSDTEEDFDYVPPIELSDTSEGERVSSDEDFKEKNKVGKKARKVCKVENKVTKAKAVIAVNEKQTADDVYKCFLEEVEKEETGICSGENLAATSDCNEQKENSKTPPIASSRSSSKKNSESLLEFAGEVIVRGDGCTKPRSDTPIEFPSFRIARGASSSKEGVPSEIPNAKRKGLDTVLSTIMTKRKKITTLEKSHIDWNLFKKQEGIEQELEKFNKGKFGYLERQCFLARSDLQSFEIERAMRLYIAKK